MSHTNKTNNNSNATARTTITTTITTTAVRAIRANTTTLIAIPTIIAAITTRSGAAFHV